MRSDLTASFMRCLGAAVAICFFMFLMASAVTHAENTWLEKGRGLWNTFGVKSGSSDMTVKEIGAGLKEALRVGTENVVARLGQTDGFNKDPAVHIPLPGQLAGMKSALDKIGMAGRLEDLEQRLNRAAEVATPRAKQLFVQAIEEMSFDDVMTIYKGPKDAATQYFRGKMSPALTQEMAPVVEKSLAQVEAVQKYDSIMNAYRSIPFVPEVKADLTDYVVEKGMDGIFYYMAREEAAIRADPAKRTTDLLRRVFGGA